MSMPYEPYQELAKRLGLGIYPANAAADMTYELTLRGMVRGHPVSMVRNRNRGDWLSVEVRLQPAMDLGLRFSPSGVVESVKDWFGAVDIQIGVPTLDSAFAIRGDEPERIRALFQGALQSAVEPWRWRGLTIRDDMVRTFETQFEDDALDLELRLGSVVELAERIEVARWTVPPAAPLLAIAQRWDAFASEHGLQLSVGSPMCMTGALGSTQIRVSARRRAKDKFNIELWVYFDKPLDCRLFVGTRQRPNTTLGDPEFDDAFGVWTDEPDKVARILDREVRLALVANCHGRELNIQSHGLMMVDDSADFTPDSVLSILSALSDLAGRMSRNARLSGIYR